MSLAHPERIPEWAADDIEAFIALLRGEDEEERPAPIGGWKAGRCPECGGDLVPCGRCRTCPACGWEACAA